jgi:hypothetical protein
MPLSMIFQLFVEVGFPIGGGNRRRIKSWKPECVGSFNMAWRILVFYPVPEARDKIY